MRKTLNTSLILFILLSPLFLVTYANAFSLGVGGGWSTSPYKKYTENYSPFPYIDYDNDIFFIDNLSAGVYLYNQDQQSLSIGVNYLSAEFNPHKSKNHRLKLLDKRRTTLLAEIEYSIATDWGGFSSSIGTDMLNESNSLLINVDYSLPFMLGDLIIMPTLGLNWANGHHNNYYYGISHKESLRSGLSYYKATNSLTPYIELNSQYPLTQNITTFGGIRVDKLADKVTNSAMVARSTTTSIFMGIFYTF